MAERRTTILLVDDEPDIVQILMKGLNQHGYAVTGFTDPEKALADFKPDKYDAIILDVKMPKMTGFDLARSIWKLEPGAKVCFLSAFEIHQDEAEMVFKSMQSPHFVKKPISTASLAEYIEKQLLDT